MPQISKRSPIVSAGIVVVRKVDDEYLYLLLRNRDYQEPPKGRPLPNETLLETAIRETQEEAGIGPEALNFRWGEVSKASDRYKSGTKYVVWFVAETTQADVILEVNPELGHPEHQSFLWVRYDEARKLVNERIGKILEWAKGVIE